MQLAPALSLSLSLSRSSDTNSSFLDAHYFNGRRVELLYKNVDSTSTSFNVFDTPCIKITGING